MNVVFLDLRAEGTQHLLSGLNSGRLESHHIPCATVTLSCGIDWSQERVKWYLVPVDSKKRMRKGINLFHTSENFMQDHNHDGENVQWKGTRKLVLPDFSGRK